jgi:hypothetical protein
MIVCDCVCDCVLGSMAAPERFPEALRVALAAVALLYVTIAEATALAYGGRVTGNILEVVVVVAILNDSSLLE